MWDDSPISWACITPNGKASRQPPDRLVMTETYPPVELYLFRNPNFFRVLVVSLFLKAWKQGGGRA